MKGVFYQHPWSTPVLYGPWSVERHSFSAPQYVTCRGVSGRSVTRVGPQSLMGVRLDRHFEPRCIRETRNSWNRRFVPMKRAGVHDTRQHSSFTLVRTSILRTCLPVRGTSLTSHISTIIFGCARTDQTPGSVYEDGRTPTDLDSRTGRPGPLPDSSPSPSTSRTGRSPSGSPTPLLTVWGVGRGVNLRFVDVHSPVGEYRRGIRMSFVVHRNAHSWGPRVPSSSGGGWHREG